MRLALGYGPHTGLILQLGRLFSHYAIDTVLLSTCSLVISRRLFVVCWAVSHFVRLAIFIGSDEVPLFSFPEGVLRSINYLRAPSSAVIIYNVSHYVLAEVSSVRGGIAIRFRK